MPENPRSVYSSKWQQFTRLSHTSDSLALERRGWRRWLLLPYLAFIIPVTDPAVVAQLSEWQHQLGPWLQYVPLAPDHFHITLHYVGLLRRRSWLLLPRTWPRESLPRLAESVQADLNNCNQFDVRIGPLNAFSNVLFAEVQDDSTCLRRLRARLRRALPLRARPPLQWGYLPHVTLGYWGDQPGAPLVEAIAPYRNIDPILLHVDTIKFTVLTRDSFPLERNLLNTFQEDIVATYHLKETQPEPHDRPISC